MSSTEDALKRARLSRDYAKGLVPYLENKWGLIIEVDFKVLEEAALKAGHTLGDIEIDEPNHIKQAAHMCFWIRKLKPLRIFRFQAFQDAFAELSGLGKIRGSLNHIDAQDAPAARAVYLNETFAMLVALGIICSHRAFAGQVKIDPEHFNDLAVSLRYHSYSPSALAAILAAHFGITPHEPTSAA